MKRKTCTKCGSQNTPNQRYCGNCGESLELSNKAYVNPEQFELLKKSLSKKFELLEEIGKGGMSIVYKAIQKNLDRIVALKVINSNLMKDPESMRMFHQEAKTAASLQHPNIITIYDQGESSGFFYISMEYLEGKELSEIIEQQGPLDAVTFVEYFSQLADALNYLSDRELVHMDIKCSNIMITNDGRPIILDFGISKIKSLPDAFENASIVGTPEYMSPEQASGGKVDERSDVYSLGIVMYKCLTGVFPFTGNNYSAIIEDILHRTPVRPIVYNKELKGGYDAIVVKLLEKDPSHRFQTGKELKAALLKPPRQMPSTEKILKYAITVLSVFLVVGAVVFYLSYDWSNHIQSTDTNISTGVGTTAIIDEPIFEPWVPPGIRTVSLPEGDLPPSKENDWDPFADNIVEDNEGEIPGQDYEEHGESNDAQTEVVIAKPTPSASNEPSAAAQSANYESTLDEAIELFNNKNYDAALRKFQEANRINPNSQAVKEYIDIIEDKKANPD